MSGRFLINEPARAWAREDLMGVPTRKEYFIGSKCERCGKAQSRRNQDAGDLFTLPHEWGAPLADQGSFCQKCISRYTPEEWLKWFYPTRAIDALLKGE